MPGAEAAWFGLWGEVVRARQSGAIVRRGVFYPERLPAGDVEAICVAAASLGIPEPDVVPWASFLKLLYKRTYKHRVPLVAAGLAEQLGLLAADWEPGPDDGTELIVWTQPPAQRKRAEKRRRSRLRNGQIENPNRPRTCSKTWVMGSSGNPLHRPLARRCP